MTIPLFRKLSATICVFSLAACNGVISESTINPATHSLSSSAIHNGTERFDQDAARSRNLPIPRELAHPDNTGELPIAANISGELLPVKSSLAPLARQTPSPTPSPCLNTGNYYSVVCITIAPGQTGVAGWYCNNCTPSQAPLTWANSTPPPGLSASWSPNPAPYIGDPFTPSSNLSIAASLALLPQSPDDIQTSFKTNVGSQGSLGDVRITIKYTTAQKIYLAAYNWFGKSDASFIPSGGDCGEGCVYTINGLIHQGTGSYLCGSSGTASTDVVKTCSNVSKISDATQNAGDLVIVDSADGRAAHIGICLNSGCTQMNSNASHGFNGGGACVFNFNAPNFQYPGSPYNTGTVSYWRVS